MCLSDGIAATLHPGEPRRSLNPETLDVPQIHLLVARCAGAAAGCCALFERPDEAAELKRMVVDPAYRGRAITLLRLEVGLRNAAGKPPYRREAYRDSAPFGGCRASPLSRFLAKSL